MYTKTHIHICGWLHQDDSAKQLAKWHWKELDSISHVIHIHSIIWPNAFVRECSYTVRIPIMGWITISRGFTYFYIFVHFPCFDHCSILTIQISSKSHGLVPCIGAEGCGAVRMIKRSLTTYGESAASPSSWFRRLAAFK